MAEFEQFVDQIVDSIDLDIMPGEADFSNSFLPQQPFNSCLFPSIAQRKNRSLNLVTNPHQFEMEGLTFLGSAG